MRGKIGSPGVAVKLYYGRRYSADGKYPMKKKRDGMQI
jgi:hypothetical protein